jgi:hypothetical protein
MMTIERPEASNEAEMAWAFPSVDPGAKPLGGRILVQLRRTKKEATRMGIILVEETREAEKWNNMVAKVIEVGPLAFGIATRCWNGPKDRGARRGILSACLNGAGIVGK